MSVEIPPYLTQVFRLADELPDLLNGAPPDMIDAVARRLRELAILVAARDKQIHKMEQAR